MNVLIFFISWFVVGFICMFILWIDSMRGAEFDPDFFSQDDVIPVSIILFVFGYISPFIIGAFYMQEKKCFTRLIYKIANIGVKKDCTNDSASVPPKGGNVAQKD